MDIKDRLNKVFQQVFADDSISIFASMTAADLDDWDSLSHIQLIVAIEKDFGIKFKTVEITSLKNVGEMIALIERKLTQ